MYKEITEPSWVRSAMVCDPEHILDFEIAYFPSKRDLIPCNYGDL